MKDKIRHGGEIWTQDQGIKIEEILLSIFTLYATDTGTVQLATLIIMIIISGNNIFQILTTFLNKK